MRISKVKPGKMDVFKKAMADQRAWYTSHGMTMNQLKAGPTFTGAGLSADQMVTIHLNSPSQRPDGDAGYNAFVAELRDSSDIVTETRFCAGDIR